jgi:hypothetical protein
MSEARIWPGGFTTEEVMAQVAEGYYAAKRRRDAEIAKAESARAGSN